MRAPKIEPCPWSSCSTGKLMPPKTLPPTLITPARAAGAASASATHAAHHVRFMAGSSMGGEPRVAAPRVFAR